MMGSPEDELEHRNSESPQHSVNIKQFFMGRYPVTQAQWRAVVALPEIDRELKPEPSYFKGDKRPVERVSWYDAVEFCSRLAAQTKRPYSLPSEAEWEYACRAGTITPFHFGETITTDLANYRGTDYEEFKLSGSYGHGLKGIYREQTTEVGSFGAANGFGLCDMHGNVWEWCLDDWHDNYEGAPTDGNAWLDENDDRSQEQQKSTCLRGGSWYLNPGLCRSASRNYYDRAVDNTNNIGFRVAYGVGRILW